MAQSRDETAKRPNSALGSCGHDAEGASKDITEEQRSQEKSEQQVHTGFQKGCLSSLVVIPTIRNATKYGRSTKWALTTLAAMAALAAPLGSNIILPVLKPISEYFDTSHTVVNLSIALYALAVAITPLWWSSMAEAYGRRMVYLVTFLLLAVFNILCAVSSNIGMFIAMRLLAGGACASVQAVGAGTVADLWEPQDRGRAMGIFSLGPMLGPLTAPIIGAALDSRWGWRSTQWFLVIYGLVVWTAMLVLLPETLTKYKVGIKLPVAAADSEHQQDHVTSSADKAKSVVKVLVSPMLSVRLLRYVPILIVVYYTSITFASNYLLNISVQGVFSRPPYEWSVMIVGLAYIPSSVGGAAGAILGGRWTDHCMKRAARKAGRVDVATGKPIFHPQDRISENFWVAAIMYPAALLWYGWTARGNVFWVVPLIANFFFGFGFMLISSVTMTVMTEFVPGSTTTGVAVTNLVRNTLGCVAAIVADPLIQAIGNGWTFTIAFFICILSGALMIFMKRNWELWRKEMEAIREQLK
ncbi:uncharacterized protein LMH87_008459 [Akanthomyces muscarius]|uniref:Major facilitator superfamily (MFS) profile domain-containing protein n=1 Tax=Akanthomyces muscarius TaxID=2231603 RepID=A0A9W8QJR9_AKAMU|nr:uncharacterized protein LMH87_008459 [Akanthomyces muscarius]KAJ4159561.1 hypothetical protein LMH87_008459 [Akanthomyces muscarius]